MVCGDEYSSFNRYCVFRDGAKLDIGIKGIILGDHFDWQLTIDFPPKLDDIVSNTWDKVKDHIHL